VWRHIWLKRKWGRRIDERSRRFDCFWLWRHVGQQVDAFSQRQVASWRTHFRQIVADITRASGRRQRSCWRWWRWWRWRRYGCVLCRNTGVGHVRGRCVPRVEVLQVSSRMNGGCHRWGRWRRGWSCRRWGRPVARLLIGSAESSRTSMIVNPSELIGTSNTGTSESCRCTTEKKDKIIILRKFGNYQENLIWKLWPREGLLLRLSAGLWHFAVFNWDSLW